MKEIVLFSLSLLVFCFAGFGEEQMSMAAAEAALSDEELLGVAQLVFENRDGSFPFRVFSELAQKGNPTAMAWLGRCYMDGVGTAQDYAEAFRCFSQAAAQREPWALDGQGVCYQHGLGVARNLLEARRCHMQALSLGHHPQATLNLACLYLADDFRDDGKAEDFFIKALLPPATPKDFARADLLYADFLFSQGRYEEALPRLLRNTDDPLALRRLIECYENGLGTKVDIGSAVALADELARRDPDPAAKALAGGVLFNAAMDEIVKAGFDDRSMELLRRAADYGDMEAQYEYGSMLEQQNRAAEGLPYLLRSAEQGWTRAILRAGVCAAGQKRFDLALDHLLRATAYPFAEIAAIEHIVSIYLYDLKEPWLACNWARRGAELGSTFCRLRVFEQGIEQRTEAAGCKAFVEFELAVLDGDENAVKCEEDYLRDYYELLRQAADNGNRDALCALGLYGILRGDDHPSVPVGLELLGRAADADSPEACRILGNVYFNGVIVPKDMQKAMEWYQKGAKLGDMVCADSVVLLYRNEPLFKDTSFEEIRKWGELARGMDGEIAFVCGELAEHVGKDAAAAMELYQQAANRHDIAAMKRLYLLKQESDGDAAIDYLVQAAALGNTEAEVLVGNYLLEHQGAARVAFGYFMRAYFHGDTMEASRKLGVMMRAGTGCEVNAPLGMELLNQAYDNGDRDCCLILGNIFANGDGVQRDVARARACFEEGVRRGDKACAKAIEMLDKEK